MSTEQETRPGAASKGSASDGWRQLAMPAPGHARAHSGPPAGLRISRVVVIVCIAGYPATSVRSRDAPPALSREAALQRPRSMPGPAAAVQTSAATPMTA
jgi:hypothetical protein